nr:immunoglobulin heavy chain junction region [Macaca mulatta]MOW88031.1 immunoglobulin heavy chain junction region [Macaca mulatta]MOW88381.1 immunoglobulin heavy chain junction region [Macaca mulatta]MOW89555.1 immunoglobulin heavy chain junction region [Macaca mulatta]MOW90989.1 immunoglobulin heavy chain junction region [Macaca mulatta]
CARDMLVVITPLLLIYNRFDVW